MKPLAVLVAVGLAVGSACGTNVAAGGPSLSTRATASSDPVMCPAPPAGWTEHRAAGLCLAAPQGWTFTDASPAPMLVTPPIFLALGTWRFPPGGDCAPTRALADLPRNGTFLWLFEYVDPANRDPKDFPRRPDHFALGKLGGPFECVGRKTYLILFREHRRFFQIHVVFGSKAHQSLHRQVLASLDSLVVEPPG